MDYKIICDKNLPYFQIRLLGQLNAQTLETCYREMLCHPRWKTAANVLWDVRQCSLAHLGVDDVRSIADMTVKYQDQRGNGCAAWVVSGDVDFGISRMFELQNQGKIDFDFMVFRNISDATHHLLSIGNSI